LDHTISSEGIAVDPGKVQEVMEWKPPTSIHQIRNFLGLVGYYRCFIPDFSIITKPITELLKKVVKFMRSEKSEKAFHTLREHLITAQSWINMITPSDSMFIVRHPTHVLVVCLCKITESLPTLHELFNLMNRIIQHMISS
jgi:hypothetical protein